MWVGAGIHPAQQVSFEMFPEGLVPQPVHDGADEAWDDLHDHVRGKSDLQQFCWEEIQQASFQCSAHIGDHTQEELQAMQQDGVSGLPGIATGGSRCEHDA